MSENTAAARIDRCRKAIAAVALTGSLMAGLPLAHHDWLPIAPEDKIITVAGSHFEHEPHDHLEMRFTRTVLAEPIIVTGAPLPTQAKAPGWQL